MNCFKILLSLLFLNIIYCVLSDENDGGELIVESTEMIFTKGKKTTGKQIKDELMCMNKDKKFCEKYTPDKVICKKKKGQLFLSDFKCSAKFSDSIYFRKATVYCDTFENIKGIYQKGTCFLEFDLAKDDSWFKNHKGILIGGTAIAFLFVIIGAAGFNQFRRKKI